MPICLHVHARVDAINPHPPARRECADKWKDYIENEGGGKLYIGERLGSVGQRLPRPGCTGRASAHKPG